MSRPAWTVNNPGLFIYWMKTGASQAPADWIDEDALDEDALDEDALDEDLRAAGFKLRGALP